MAGFSQEFLERTRKEWQKFSPSPLSLEDAREIAENVTNYFSLLSEWERKERQDKPKGL